MKNKHIIIGISTLLVATLLNTPPTFAQQQSTPNNQQQPAPSDQQQTSPNNQQQLSPANQKQTTTNNQSDQINQKASPLQLELALFAYPIITMNTTRQMMTNVSAPTNSAAPMGQFANMKSFPNASFTNVTAPNADTLYSVAWLDLTKEPYILHVPNENGRYYLLPMLDAWTNVFASPGTRTTGTKVNNFAIVGPGWNGNLPNGVTEIKAPTNLVWIIGRTYCSGTPQDYQAVHAIQSQYTLTPLSAYGTDYTPPNNVPIDSTIDMKTPPREQVNNMDAAAYFNELNILMQNNPPAKIDRRFMAAVTKMGIQPGQPFDISKLDPSIVPGMQNSVKEAIETIEANISKFGVSVNGWQYIKTGTYGGDYLRRAVVTYVGLGANLPQDAMYPITSIDDQGQQLNGANNYVIHFTKGKMPPVRGFWSLTMYNDKYYFVNNSLNRYRINSSDKLTFNKDGSVDIYIQNQSPSADKAANWLPAPTGNFNLCFRFYWPTQEIINGKWKPPVVTKVS